MLLSTHLKDKYSCPCCFFPRRVPGQAGSGVGRGIPASRREIVEDGVSWCRGFGSGFAQLSCSKAAAPAGGCQSGFCKFILLGFANKGRFGDQNCSLS